MGSQLTANLQDGAAIVEGAAGLKGSRRARVPRRGWFKSSLMARIWRRPGTRAFQVKVRLAKIFLDHPPLFVAKL
jgi:hypothetical protein